MKILDIPQSGSVGAVTSSRNRSGQYRRMRAFPTQPRTAAQVNARMRLTTQSAAWRGLTDVQRAGWNAFANTFTVVNSLGQTINLTGAQCFVKVNCVNLLNGAATVLVPPLLPAFVAATSTGIVMTAGTPLFSITGANPAAGTVHMAFCSPQMSPGVSYNGQYRWIATFSVYSAGVYNLLAAYTAKFGALIATKRVFCKIVQTQAGMQDNGTLYNALVGA